MLSAKHTILFILFIFRSLMLPAQLQSFGLHVDKSGSGEQAIVFIPGLGCSGTVWNSTKKKLKKEYTCYTLTMPGFAGNKPLPKPSFKEFEGLIVKFIQENAIQKPFLIGHSLGGSLAMAVAADHPDLVSKLIITDALPFLLALNDSTVHPNLAACPEEVQEMMQPTREEFLTSMKQSVWRMVSDTSAQKNVVDWAIRSDRYTFAKLYCDLTNTDLRKRLRTVTCPTLILLQPYFMDFQPAVEEQFLFLKQKKISYASTGLHFIMYDNFDWFIGQVSSFLKD